MIFQSSQPDFVRAATDHLRAKGLEAFDQFIHDRWSVQDLCEMTRSESADVRKLACLGLAAVGDDHASPALVRALADADRQVAELAEHALWAIWHRSGQMTALPMFRAGLAAMSREDPRTALIYFHRALEIDPTFVEAEDQAAIAHYLLEQWLEAADCWSRVVRANPYHFSAMAGLGHCHFNLGNLELAARWYRRSLQVNPLMPAVADSLARIERSVAAVAAG